MTNQPTDPMPGSADGGDISRTSQPIDQPAVPSPDNSHGTNQPNSAWPTMPATSTIDPGSGRTQPTTARKAGGLKQFATELNEVWVTSGAKDLVHGNRSPVAGSQVASGNPSNNQGALRAWAGRAPLALAVVCVIALITLSIPVGSDPYGDSLTFFSNEASGEGWLQLVLLLLTIGAIIAARLTPAKWSRIVMRVMAFVAALAAIFDGIGAISAMSTDGYSSGAGGVLLLLLGLVMLFLAVLLCLTGKTTIGKNTATVLPAPSPIAPEQAWRSPTPPVQQAPANWAAQSYPQSYPPANTQNHTSQTGN